MAENPFAAERYMAEIQAAVTEMNERVCQTLLETRSEALFQMSRQEFYAWLEMAREACL